MIAVKPPELSDLEAASAPVIGVTALQMLWDHAKLEAGQSVLIHGAMGNVGRYAVRMAAARGLSVLATARPQDRAILQALPLSGTVNLSEPPDRAPAVDAAIDLVGGPSQAQLLDFVKRGGALVSMVSPPDAATSRARGVLADFFIVDVDTSSLNELAALFRAGVIRPSIGAVFPLSEARRAHELMAARFRPPGKILLQVAELAPAG
jgi:NADPH:quinone reductase-like Zn-dependent oxidoreductase